MKRLIAGLLLVEFAAGCAQAATTTPTSEPSPTVAAIPTVNNGLGANEGIAEIHMFDAQRGWGWAKDVGGNSRLVNTVDGGATWTDRSPAGLAYGQQGASFLDADHAWLPTFDSGSNEAGLMRTVDGGNTWTPVSSAGGPYISYQFTSENDGIANTADVGAGNAYVRFFQTHDGGANWSVVAIQPPRPESLPEGTLHICNICGDTASLFLPGRVIITHGDLAGDPQGAVRLSVSMDLGKTWNELRLPLPADTYDKAAVAPQAPVFTDEQHGVMPVHIFKTQDYTTYAYKVLALYSTSDGGQTWSAGATVAEDVQTYEPALDLLSTTDVIVRCGTGLCATRDAGTTWAPTQPDLDLGAFGGERQLIQIDFIDLRTGWAVIDDDDLYKLYRTTDGGVTWNLPGR